MGEIAKSDRQISLYYNSNSVRAKQTLAYAKAEGLRIREVDILKTRLNLEVKDLVNQSHPAFTAKFEPMELSPNDWIKLIQHNPEIMKQPIALRGDLTILVETPTDIIKI